MNTKRAGKESLEIRLTPDEAAIFRLVRKALDECYGVSEIARGRQVKRKKPYRCVCCGYQVTGEKAKRLSGKRAVCVTCEAAVLVFREKEGAKPKGAVTHVVTEVDQAAKTITLSAPNAYTDNL